MLLLLSCSSPTLGIDALEEALAITKKKEYHLLQVYVLERLGKMYPYGNMINPRNH